MRFVSLLLLTAGCLLCTACSYATDFVVVNNSVQPIDVRYRISEYAGEFGLRDKPASIKASNLDSHGGQEWNLLSSDQFQVDQKNRMVTVRVMPGDGLRIVTLLNYEGHDDAWRAGEFPIDQLFVSGANGELTLTGPQARTTFIKISRALYTLTYK